MYIKLKIHVVLPWFDTRDRHDGRGQFVPSVQKKVTDGAESSSHQYHNLKRKSDVVITVNLISSITLFMRMNVRVN